METILLSNVEASRFLLETHQLNVPAWALETVKIIRRNGYGAIKMRFFCWKWKNENGSFCYMRLDGQLFDRWAEKNAEENKVVPSEGVYDGDVYLSLNVNQSSVVLFDSFKKVDVIYKPVK